MLRVWAERSWRQLWGEVLRGPSPSGQDDGKYKYKCNYNCNGNGNYNCNYNYNGNSNGEMRGALHCATHDETVSGFGRDDAVLLVESR